MRSSIWEWPIFLASVTILTSGKKQARQWLQKSADRGNNMAQLALGDMYAFGQGIPQNKKQAMTLFLLGRVNFQLSDEELQFMALQGDTQAQIKLASKYGTGGSDCSRNESLALYWLREAATTVTRGRNLCWAWGWLRIGSMTKPSPGLKKRNHKALKRLAV
ncbi:sel1 repeat family protein [Salmonella enterica]|nr:sel1 repeat family protein [Salmonella enterica]MBA2147726.1 sel1 repeat family protein [Salmonella enterica subsp. houtenae serovar 45:g,z51:-]EFO7608458.1 sel1 repeat family protein [Salmonella enterica]EFT4030773.1 sel1 repeat family protein [Salmonella enterica]EGH6795091.1 sel1 repeat family protein [Salmonella enterica]